jgi:hypothetical protein
MTGKVWARIPEFPDYAVSGDGEVMRVVDKNYKAGGILKPQDLEQYPKVSLCRDGQTFNVRIHKLVADAFVPNPDDKPAVNHIDGNKNNIAFDNLEWTTHAENQQHAIATGLSPTGEKHHSAKLTDTQIQEIRKRRSVGEPIKKLGEEFGVHQGHISKICHGRLR